MGVRRMPAARAAGIAAWTAASVTWTTAVVALANVPQEPSALTPVAEHAAALPVEQQEAVLEAVPTLPDSGLVVLRYTAAERAEPEVIVRRVVTAAPTGAPTKTAAPTRVKSSGS